MDFDEILKKRVRAMAVRILSTIEHRFGVDDLDSLEDSESLDITGSDLKVIRSEILNAAGDTTRSLQNTEGSKGKPVSLSRDVIQALNKAVVDIIEDRENDDDIPIFIVSGNFNLLHKIRAEIGTGVVYNKQYKCAGIDSIVDSLLPFLDSAQIAGIKIAGGEYREWRDAVCEMYLEGLGDE